MFAETFDKIAQHMLRPVRMTLSLCSGLAPELELKDMMQLPFDTSNMHLIDADEKVCRYLVARYGGDVTVLQNFTSVKVPGRSFGYCHNYGAERGRDLPTSEVTLVGFPCDPYSSQSRAASAAPEKHPAHVVAFGEGEDDETMGVIAVLRKQKPKGVIFENVLRFNSKRRSGRYRDETPLDVFKAKMFEIHDAVGRQLYTGFAYVSLDSDNWNGVKRPRLRYSHSNSINTRSHKFSKNINNASEAKFKKVQNKFNKSKKFKTAQKFKNNQKH